MGFLEDHLQFHETDITVLLETWEEQEIVIRGDEYHFCEKAIHTNARQSGGTYVGSTAGTPL